MKSLECKVPSSPGEKPWRCSRGQFPRQSEMDDTCIPILSFAIHPGTRERFHNASFSHSNGIPSSSSDFCLPIEIPINFQANTRRKSRGSVFKRNWSGSKKCHVFWDFWNYSFVDKFSCVTIARWFVLMFFGSRSRFCGIFMTQKKKVMVEVCLASDLALFWTSFPIFA